MHADLTAHIGEPYRHEFYEGEAEDWAKVVAVNQSVNVPFGSFTGCIQTEDWNGLDPTLRDYKYYCSQLGVVLEVPVNGSERLELINVTTP